MPATKKGKKTSATAADVSHAQAKAQRAGPILRTHEPPQTRHIRYEDVNNDRARYLAHHNALDLVVAAPDSRVMANIAANVKRAGKMTADELKAFEARDGRFVQQVQALRVARPRARTGDVVKDAVKKDGPSDQHGEDGKDAE